MLYHDLENFLLKNFNSEGLEMRCNYEMLGDVRRELVNKYWKEFKWSMNYSLWNDFPSEHNGRDVACYSKCIGICREIKSCLCWVLTSSLA